jgi:AcrR family transcriptional regulator
MKDTQTDDQTAKGWRGSREVWLDAAKAAFVENGVDAVKIQPLASGLKLSRTSFYWFFKDREALLDALLEDWEAKNTGAFVDACTAYAETVAEAVLNLIVVFHDPHLFDPKLDFAVRSWAHHSQPVMERINAADDRRLAAIRAMFLRFGVPEQEADVRARTVYLTQIGYIAMQVQESTATRMARVPEYVKTFCGSAPTTSECARFHARLKFDPLDQNLDRNSLAE